MKKLFYILITVVSFSCTTHEENVRGIIGKYYENDLPVVVKLDNVKHDTTITNRLPWFTVISWKYDGSAHNGFPPEPIKTRMFQLEHVLDSMFSSNPICKHAYTRTGNNLKEYNYYIADRVEFMKQFNTTLQHRVHYPIEIVFYEDSAWVEQQIIIKDFLE